MHLSFITHDADFECKDSITQSSAVVIELPSHHNTYDLKILDKGALMLLIAYKGWCFVILTLQPLADITITTDSSLLVIIPNKAVADLKHAGTRPKASVAPNLVPNGRALGAGRKAVQIKAAELMQYTKHTFASDDRFKPAKLEVNDRTNRRVVVVLGEDGRQVRILDLDYKEGDQRPDLLGGEAGGSDGEEMDVG